MKREINVGIIIPAYNEELSIGKTIDGLAIFFPNAHYVVVDNNSSDNTNLKAKEAFTKNNLTGFVVFEKNKGKGNAVKLGLQRLRPDYWVMTDADATYSPLALRNLLEYMIVNRLDHGVADRMSENSYKNKSELRTAVHKFGNKLITKLITKVTGIDFKDVLSGGRVFSSAFIDSIYIDSTGFQLESEINIKAAELNITTIEIDTPYDTRNSDNPSKLSTFIDGFKIIRFIFGAALFKRPERLFYLFSIILLIPGLYLSCKLINYYLINGGVPYSSTAVAASIFLIISFQTILFSNYIKIQREIRIHDTRRNFSILKRVLNEKLETTINTNY